MKQEKQEQNETISLKELREQTDNNTALYLALTLEKW